MAWLNAQPLAILIAIGGLTGVLSLGSLAALVLGGRDDGRWADLGPRMRSWWLIAIVLVASLLAGWQVFAIVWAIISFIALREFLTLAPTRKEDRIAVFVEYLAIPAIYLTLFTGRYGVFLVLIPVYWFLAKAVIITLQGRTDQFLTTIGIMHWGAVICVFNLAHVAWLVRIPAAELPPAGPAGLVFFLLFITQINDALQYIWGKALGRRKITPQISPNKTIEGAVGGILSTALLFVVLAPVFTPLDLGPSLFIGLTLPILGFFGDVTMSAIKRDLGVKDTSMLIPGHGGALDRLDSLTFTAPYFFHMLAFFALERF